MNILDIKRKTLGHYFLKGDGGGGGGGSSANDGNAGEAEAKANMAPAPTPYDPGAQDPAQQQQAAIQTQADATAAAAAQAQAAADAASPFGAMSEGFKTTPENQRAMADSAMSQGFKMTPDNAGAQADQATVRDFLARVEADKQYALSKPGEQYNVNDPNVGTNLTNAALAAVDSGLNSQTIQMSGGKNNPMRDVTTLTSNIPIARFLGYTGDPGNSALSYGEAQQLRDLKLGNLTGVNLNNMPGTGLSVAGGDGMPIPGLTYNEPGQTADSIVAATDAAEVAGKIWDGLKNFIPGYGLAMMVGNLISGKMTLGDAILSVGLGNLARSIGTTPGTLTALANGNMADAFTSQLVGYGVKDISNTYKVDPRVVSVGLGMSGAPQAVNKSLSAGNMNLGTTRALSNAIQAPINAAANAVGTSFGTGESTGQMTNTGDTLGDQIDRAVGNGSTSAAPATPAPASGTPTTPSSPLSSLSIPSIGGAGSSAGSSSSGALSESGSAKASTTADSALKSSYLGGTGNTKATDKEMKSMTDPLSASSSSVIKSEDTSGTQTARTDPFKYDFYAYGDVPDISANLQVKDGGSISSPLVEANRVVHKVSGGGIMATPLMAAAGDVPHKGSHYVQGAGGGQDDLIDARLADGEYVFDADIVSALGDGSNKEGAAKLDSMREAIRKHKRSAPVNKIPPKAKSPLAYMRG